MIARNGRPFISALLFLLLTMSLPAARAVGEEAKFRPVMGGIEGDYIVALQKDLPPVQIAPLAQELAAKHGATVRIVWQHALKGFWASMPEAAARAMSTDPRVRYVTQNVPMQESGSQVTYGVSPKDHLGNDNDAPYPIALGEHPLWHLSRLSHRLRAEDVGSFAEAPAGYRYDYAPISSGAGTTIYVFDSGVLRFHQEFVNNNATGDPSTDPAAHTRIREIAGSNHGADHLPSSAPFSVRDTNTSCDPPAGSPTLQDEQGNTIAYFAARWFADLAISHGTATASVAAGRNVGVAKEARIVPVRINNCKGATTQAIYISAINWILGNIRVQADELRTPAVLTFSTWFPVTPCQLWEGGTEGRCFTVPSVASPGLMNQYNVLPFEEAIEQIIDEGIPVVASANNNVRDACQETPARLSRSGGFSKLKNGRVITVGGWAKDGDYRWVDPAPDPDPVTHAPNANPGSNWGPCIDLFAPAERIAVADTSSWKAYRGDLSSGTSFSAPMVAGLLARMLSEDEDLKSALKNPATRRQVPDVLWERLRDSATPFDPAALLAGEPCVPPNPCFPPNTNPPFADLLATNDLAAATFEATPRRLAYMGAFSIKEQPQPKVLKGTAQSLTVTPVGAAADSVAWYEGESGVTSQSLGVAESLCVRRRAANEPDDGCQSPAVNTKYWARVTRDGMTTDSAAATVVVDAPLITKQPASAWAGEGQDVTLEVEVLAPEGQPPTYEWYTGSKTAGHNPIPANDSRFVVANTSTTSKLTVRNAVNSAGYFVTVTANGKSEDSDVAVIHGCPKPVILRIENNKPLRGDLRPGEGFELTAVMADSPSTYEFEWYAGEKGDFSHRLGDASGSFRTSSIVTTLARGPKFWLRVRNSACSFTDSDTYVVPLRECPTIDFPPESFSNMFGGRTVPTGGRTVLTVRAQHANPALLSYIWLKQIRANDTLAIAKNADGTDKVFGRDPVLRALADETAAGETYRALVTDIGSGCSLLSPELSSTKFACRTIIDPATITSQMVFNGATLSIPLMRSVGDQISAYTWWSGDGDIAPAVAGPRQPMTCPPCTTTLCPLCSVPLTPTAGGSYWLRVERGDDCNDNPRFRTIDDTDLIHVSIFDCAANFFELRSLPGGVAANTPFKLVAPGSLDPQAKYTWYEGFYDTRTKIGETIGDPTFERPGGITGPKRYFVEVTSSCSGGPKVSSYLTLNPCGSPRRRAVTHPAAPIQTGGTALLSVEDDHDGTTFEWYAATSHSDLSTPVGTGASVQVSPSSRTTYFVRMTKTCGTQTLVTNSDFVTVDVACNLTLDQQPQPASAVMPASGPVEVSTSVIPRGNGSFTYQWYEGGTPVPGATDATFTWSYTATASSPAVLQRTFTVDVTGACGTVTSQPVTLSILRSPQRIFAYSPGGEIPEPGAVIQLFVEMDPQASAEHSYSYEWFRDNGTAEGESIGGGKTIYATTWSLDTFWVKITGSHTAPIAWTEVTVSPKMHLSVYGECRMPPLRVTQSATAISASSVNPEQVVFTASCDGPGVQLQWYSGQSGDTRYPIDFDLGKPNQLTVGGPGDLPRPYWVRASRDCGTSQDSPTLTFTKGGCSPVLFAQHPQPVEVAYGEDALVWADVANPGGKSYEWFEGESETFIGSGLPLQLEDVTASRRVWVKVGDPPCGTSANSLVTTVRVASCSSVSVTSWPGEVWVDKGGRRSLSVDATGATSYQWYKGELGDYSQPIAGATQSTYLTDPLDADAKYWVRVFGSGCVVDSPTLRVRVCDPPHWTSNILTMTSAVPGQGIWLAVGAAGSDISYQWYKGSPADRSQPVGRPIHAYYLIAQQTADYWVEVTGRCGAGGADQRVLPSPKMTVSVCPTATEAPTAARSIVMPGTTTQLSVAAQGSRLQYQWYSKAGTTTTAIPNSNSATITSPPITADTEFWAEVRSDVGGCARATPHLTVTICREPTIRWTTSSQNVARNQPVWLGVDATIGAQVTYYAGPVGDVANSTVVSGPTVNRAVQVMPAATTTYWAMADNGAGCTARTAGLTLTVCIPTFTTQPPATRDINAGQSTPLTVATDVTSTLQWYTGEPGDTNNPIAGATGASLTVSPATDTTYWVRAIGCGGVPTDSTATLVRVCHPPAITQLTPSVWIGKGSSINLNVTATGTNPAYQWYQGNPGDISAPLAGATLPYVSVSPSNTTTYWVRVTTACGTKDSAAVVISVCAPPAIGTPPASQTIFSGTSATLSVAATQSTTTPMTYQWYAGTAPSGTAISGATGTSYTTPALTAPASYWVKVTAGTCVTNSPTATIGICALPATINGAPNAQIGVGEVVRLQVPAISPTPSQFRWYQGASGNTSTPLTGWRTYGWLDVAPSAATTQYWAEAQYGSCISKTTTTTVSVCVPAFTTQPGSPLINSGQSATLTAVANTSGVTYQWYIGTSGNTSSPISGATSATLTVAPTATTNYWVRATSSCGRTVDSNTATVTICQPAAITAQPQGASIATGQSATMTVTAAGTNLTYQWYQGSSGVTTSPVPGATSASLTVSPTVPTSYWVRVTGTCGSANSATATVNVCATPNISGQPASQTIFSGTSANLTVTASQPTGMPLSYQWYSGTSGSGTAISGATSSSYTTPVLTAQASYWVRVTSGVCSANSATATVSMCSYPATIAGAPNAQIGVGEVVRLQVPAISPVPDQYRWYQGPSGNTSTPLTGWRNYGWLDVAPTATTQYWAEVQKGSCISKTTTTTVSVCVPRITAQPASTTVVPNGSATLSVATDMSVTYQWYRGTTGSGTPISGATGSSYSTGPLTATTDYWVRATSSCGRTADSATATVTVCTPPAITSQPTNTPPVYANNYTAVGVTATGTNLTYQWYRGERGVTSAPVAGGTNAVLELYPAGTYKYWVRVTGMCGSVDSNAVWVSVYPTITTQPANVSIPSGGTATLTVQASGNDLHYQWYSGSTTPVGTDSASFTTPPLTADTSYRVIVTSGIAQKASNTATVTICQGPRFQIWTNYYEGCARVVGVTVAFEDRGDASYRWYKGEPGDTSQPVSSSYYYSTCVTETTKYWVRVSNDICYRDGWVIVYP